MAPPVQNDPLDDDMDTGSIDYMDYGYDDDTAFGDDHPESGVPNVFANLPTEYVLTSEDENAYSCSITL